MSLEVEVVQSDTEGNSLSNAATRLKNPHYLLVAG